MGLYLEMRPFKMRLNSSEATRAGPQPNLTLEGEIWTHRDSRAWTHRRHRPREEVAVCTPRSEASEETNQPHCPLVLRLCALRTGRLCSRCARPWLCGAVTAAPGRSCRAGEDLLARRPCPFQNQAPIPILQRRRLGSACWAGKRSGGRLGARGPFRTSFPITALP